MGLPPLFSVDDNSKKVLAITQKIYGSSARASGAQAQLMLRSPLELIANGDGFCGDTTGWAAYDDGAVAKPLDGTGGAPSTLTLTASTTAGEILVGKSVLKLAKSAANGQGEGQAFTFSVDAARPSTVHEIDLWYAYSANFAINGGTPASPSDVIFYLYDVTLGALVEPIGYVLDGSGHQKMYFQTTKGSTSYRLISHVATTNASAWDFFFSVSVKPAQQISQPIITDWQTITLTGSFTTNTTYTAKRRYVGNMAEYEVELNFSGAPNSTNLNVNLLDTIDTTPPKGILSTVSNKNRVFGQTYVNDNYWGSVGFNTTTNVYGYAQISAGDSRSDNVTQAQPVTIGSGTKIVMKFEFPVLGKGVTGVGTSSDLKTIAGKFSDSSSSISSSLATVVFTNSDIDTDVSYSAGVYTFKQAGYYDIFAQLLISATLYSANDLVQIQIYKNNTTALFTGGERIGSASQNQCMPTVAGFDYFSAGDTVRIRASSGGTSPVISSSADYNFFVIRKSQAPGTVIPLEKLAARYKTAAAQSIPHLTTTVIDFGTKVEDTHGRVTTGSSWNYTAKEACTLLVHALVAFNSSTVSNQEMDIRLNGSSVANKQDDISANNRNGIELTKQIDVVAGDVIDVTIFQQTGGSIPLLANALKNYIDIIKVGG